mmetsp:Transcript_104287/g.183805  ORF Transcript_104287/g.183805 Transcript_104287/m.183805 type:complete len:344 (+) Transcript_104287:73-1104(+)
MAALALNVCAPEGTPISACEETESTISGRWADITDSDDESTDVSSQDHGILARARSESATPSDAVSTQSYEPCSSGMNAEAPEFVPTLSHCCPLTGLIEVIPEEEVGRLNEAAPTFADERSSVMAARSMGSEISLAEGIWSLPGPAAPSTKGNRSARQKQRPSKLQVSLFAACVIPDEHTESLLAASQIPPATEEEWERRSENRRRSIEVGKQSEEYISYQERKALRQDALDEHEQEPMTPDPMDRNISKRRWKYEVSQWRDELKRKHSEARQVESVYGADWSQLPAASSLKPERNQASVATKIWSSESMASTEEWQSQATNTTEADEVNTIDGEESCIGSNA